MSNKISNIKSSKPFILTLEIDSYDKNDLYDEEGNLKAITKKVTIFKERLTQKEVNYLLSYAEKAGDIFSTTDNEALIDEVVDGFYSIFGETREFWATLDYTFFMQILTELNKHVSEAVTPLAEKANQKKK